MVGRDVVEDRIQRSGQPGAEALAVRGLTRNGVLHGIDLTVREGEIVGIAGLAGAGRTEVLRAIHGADRVDTGQIDVFGQPARIRSPRDAIARRIGLLTEDRKDDGLMLRQSVGFNTTIIRLAAITRRGLVRHPAERRLVADYIRQLAIRTRGSGDAIRGLSGGNQQKVIFAKWLHADCRILLVDEPTRGVDVGAKREIWQLLANLAAQGTAIVMVSSELPEVLALSDRIVVMRDGRVTAELDRADATEERIMHHATHG